MWVDIEVKLPCIDKLRERGADRFAIELPIGVGCEMLVNGLLRLNMGLLNTRHDLLLFFNKQLRPPIEFVCEFSRLEKSTKYNYLCSSD